MILVEASIISSQAAASSAMGINLLDGLGVRFGLNYERRFDENKNLYSTENPSKQRQIILRNYFSVPDINYSLNIFNSGQEKNEVLARPVIVALDGQKSRFHSGEKQYVVVSGLNTGDLKDFDTGVQLEVTPDFLLDNSIQLRVEASRSNFLEREGGDFSQAARLSTTSINSNVILQFDQTLVLSGLTEKTNDVFRSGVPLLMDIPLLKYLFSIRRTREINRSIIILLTPRRASKAYYEGEMSDLLEKLDQPEAEGLPNLRELRLEHGDWFESAPPLQVVFEHLRDNRYYREFRSGDIFVDRWLDQQSKIDQVILRALRALYNS
jgi:general secretion pathway protein D